MLVCETAHWRLVRALDQPDFPLTYRVIWRAHVAEFSDLSAMERQECMEAVALVERSMRDYLAPAKINLAALGNMVPHLHWHIIARFMWDSRFPAPVWAAAQRCVATECWQSLEKQKAAMEQHLRDQVESAVAVNNT